MSDDNTTLEALIAQIRTGMILVDDAGRVVQINRAAAEVFGSTRQAALTRPVTELHAGLSTVTVPVERAEVAVTRPDGASVIVGYTTTRLAGGAGVVVVLSDITEQRAREVEQEHRRRLADIGRLVGTVAHELRNPVFAISSLLQVLRGEDAVVADGELVELCDKGLDETDRVARLLDDLVALGRPEPSQPRKVDLLAEVARVREDLRHALPPLPGGQRPIVRVDCDARVARDPSWVVDPDALRNILACLMRNAWRAIAELDAATDPDCEIVVTLAHDRGQLSIAVSDRGAPLEAEDLPRVFEPFFRRGPYGPGLALTIVEQRVRRLGGAVSVTSSAASGTSFRVLLPAG